jgi:hypothetical protein
MHFEILIEDKSGKVLLENIINKLIDVKMHTFNYQSEADLPDELKKEKGIIEVIKNMSIANTDEQMRHELLARDMFLSDLATDLHAAKKEGRQEGDRLRCEKIALKMIAKGMPFEEVCDITELSIQQIEKLAKNNSKKVSEPAGKYKTSRKTKKPRKK